MINVQCSMFNVQAQTSLPSRLLCSFTVIDCTSYSNCMRVRYKRTLCCFPAFSAQIQGFSSDGSKPAYQGRFHRRPAATRSHSAENSTLGSSKVGQFSSALHPAANSFHCIDMHVSPASLHFQHCRGLLSSNRSSLANGPLSQRA